MSFNVYHIEKYGIFYLIRKEIRIFLFKLRRLFRYIPVIWTSPDYDYVGILQLLDFKLKLMIEHMQGCNLSPKAPIMKHPIRKMQIIRCHIDHFLNIDKFLPYIGEVEERPTSGKAPPEVMRRYREQEAAEKWHFDEIWRRLAKDSRGFWC